tara:strand:+ start:1042 stop:2763 length:1722 start_codon:yes stop_codon:yes gene_type:complete
MDLPVPEGQKKEMSFASHATMSKSFGTQRKTLARVITLEKKVDVLEKSGITQELFQDINQSILNINQSLLGIRDIIAEDIAVDKEIERDQDKADQQQLDAQKKEGAEKFLELETEKELVEPVEKGTKNVKSVFQRFMDAMLALFGGWMIDKAGDALKAWQEGDTDKLKDIAKNVTTALGVIGGIFLAQSAITGAIAGAVSSIATNMLFKIPAAVALLSNPATWLVMAAIVAGVLAFQQAKGIWAKYEETRKKIEADESLNLAEKVVETNTALHDANKDMSVMMTGMTGGDYSSTMAAHMFMNSMRAHQLAKDTPAQTVLRAIKSKTRFAGFEKEDVTLLNSITNAYRKMVMIDDALQGTLTDLEAATSAGDQAAIAKLTSNKEKLTLAFNQTKENIIKLEGSTEDKTIKEVLAIVREYSVMDLSEKEALKQKDFGNIDKVADILEESRFRNKDKRITGEGWANNAQMFLWSDQYEFAPKLDFNMDDILNPANQTGDLKSDVDGIIKDDTLISQSVDSDVDIEVVPIQTSGGNNTKGNNSLVKSGSNDKELTQLATTNGNDPYDLFFNSVYGLG